MSCENQHETQDRVPTAKTKEVHQVSIHLVGNGAWQQSAKDHVVDQYVTEASSLRHMNRLDYTYRDDDQVSSIRHLDLAHIIDGKVNSPALYRDSIAALPGVLPFVKFIANLGICLLPHFDRNLIAKAMQPHVWDDELSQRFPTLAQARERTTLLLHKCFAAFENFRSRAS